MNNSHEMGAPEMSTDVSESAAKIYEGSYQRLKTRLKLPLTESEAALNVKFGRPVHKQLGGVVEGKVALSFDVIRQDTFDPKASLQSFSSSVDFESYLNSAKLKAIDKADELYTKLLTRKFESWNEQGSVEDYRQVLDTAICHSDCQKCAAKGSVTCNSCNGNRMVFCSSCNGKGQKVCVSCSGQGQKQCSTCWGLGVKPEMRTEQVRCYSCSNGRMSCYSCGGSRFVNGYGGQRQSCNACAGSGQRSCNSCGGRGMKSETRSVQVDCTSCRRTGKQSCTVCSGSGQQGCQTCYLTGKISCIPCHASGKIDCSTCRGQGQRHLLGQLVLASFDENWSVGKVGEIDEGFVSAFDSYMENKRCNVLSAPVTGDRTTSWKLDENRATFKTTFVVPYLQYSANYLTHTEAVFLAELDESLRVGEDEFIEHVLSVKLNDFMPDAITRAIQSRPVVDVVAQLQDNNNLFAHFCDNPAFLDVDGKVESDGSGSSSLDLSSIGFDKKTKEEFLQTRQILIHRITKDLRAPRMWYTTFPFLVVLFFFCLFLAFHTNAIVIVADSGDGLVWSKTIIATLQQFSFVFNQSVTSVFNLQNFTDQLKIGHLLIAFFLSLGLVLNFINIKLHEYIFKGLSRQNQALRSSVRKTKPWLRVPIYLIQCGFPVVVITISMLQY